MSALRNSKSIWLWKKYPKIRKSEPLGCLLLGKQMNDNIRNTQVLFINNFFYKAADQAHLVPMPRCVFTFAIGQVWSREQTAN